jgi:hypothetical protein
VNQPAQQTNQRNAPIDRGDGDGNFMQDQSLVAKSGAFFALEKPIGPYPDGAPE